MKVFASLFWLLFYLVIFTPVAVLLRLIWLDPLWLKPDPSRQSYWQERRGRHFRPMTRQY